MIIALPYCLGNEYVEEQMQWEKALNMSMIKKEQKKKNTKFSGKWNRFACSFCLHFLFVHILFTFFIFSSSGHTVEWIGFFFPLKQYHERDSDTRLKWIQPSACSEEE